MKQKLFLLGIILGWAVVFYNASAETAPIDQQRCYSFVDAHQGQAEHDWALPGGTNFFDPRGELVQVGSINWNGPADDNGRVFITYPYSYGGGNTPVVFAQVVGPASTHVNVTTSPLFSGAYLDWHTVDDSTLTTVQFFWMAVGRDANCDPHSEE